MFNMQLLHSGEKPIWRRLHVLIQVGHTLRKFHRGFICFLLHWFSIGHGEEFASEVLTTRKLPNLCAENLHLYSYIYLHETPNMIFLALARDSKQDNMTHHIFTPSPPTQNENQIKNVCSIDLMDDTSQLYSVLPGRSQIYNFTILRHLATLYPPGPNIFNLRAKPYI